MDRAKLTVYLFGLFGLATLGQAFGLASMAGFEPQLLLFVAGGLLMGGIAARSLYQGSYEEFAVFRHRKTLFWGVVIGVVIYLVGIVFQFI